MSDNNKFFSFFKKKEDKKFIFDESYFDLKITGGKIQSELITIEGVAAQGGDKVDLQCIWFHISDSNDIVKLDIVGNSYQPSTDDIGCRFMVQTTPVLEGKDYEGMPKSVEVGPIQMDPAVQEEIDGFLENEKMTVLLQVEQIFTTDGSLTLELPCSCLMGLTLQNMELQFKQEDLIVHQLQIPLEAQFPSCISKRDTLNQFILKVDDNTTLFMKASDNIFRDIILTVVKGFYGKSVWNSQQQNMDQNEQEEQIEQQESGEHNDNLLVEQQQVEQQNNNEQVEPEIQQPQTHTEVNNTVEEQQQQSQSQSQPQSLILTQQIVQQQPTSEILEPPHDIPKIQEHKSGPIRSDHKHQTQNVENSMHQTVSTSPVKKKQNNVDLYVQINENVKLKQELSNLQQLYQKEQDKNKKQLLQTQVVTDQLNTCTKNFYILEGENQNQKKIIETLNDQRAFLQQDVNLYKGQILEHQENIQTLKQQVEQLQKKMKRQAATHDLNEAKKVIDQLKEQLAEKDLIIEATHRDHVLDLQQIEKLESIIEDQQNQLKHEQKRYESLTQEKGIRINNNSNNVNQNMTMNSTMKDKNHGQLTRVAQSAIILDDHSMEGIIGSQSCQSLENDSQSEIIRLKNQIMHLEATLRSMKLAYDQDVRVIRTNGKQPQLAISNNKDIKYLQHIANNMAEIITEKEMQLENQKNINKDLMAKIHQLQSD